MASKEGMFFKFFEKWKEKRLNSFAKKMLKDNPKLKKDLEDIVKAQTTISRKTEVRQCSTCRGSGIIFRRKKDGTPYKKHPKCQSCRGTGYTYKQLKDIAGFKFSPTSVDQVTANGFATDKTTFGSLAEIAEAKGLNEAHTFLTNMQRINALDTYINSFCKGITFLISQHLSTLVFHKLFSGS
mgnify:CR=1 FL=1